MSGVLALVGGGEWQVGCSFDAELLDAAGHREVVVLPTAAAFEHPERSVAAATEHFASLEATVRGLMVLRRPDALDPANVEAVRAARFVYLVGGSPMHLRSVLKDSPLWDALLATWHDGAVVAGSSAGAMVLCDPMVDPRGGAFTLGLGLVEQLAVLPHRAQWSEDRVRRTLDLASPGIVVAGIDEQTALVRDADGSWRTAGAGAVDIHVDGRLAGLEALPG